MTVNHEQCSFYMLSACCGTDCNEYYRWGLFLIPETAAQEGVRYSAGSFLIDPVQAGRIENGFGGCLKDADRQVPDF